MDNLEGRLRIILSRKSPGEATKQQRGALQFYLQDQLNKAKIIANLKANLSGPNDQEGKPYDHRASGYLEKSIMPAADGDTVWTKRFVKVALTGDKYFGLGISLDTFRVQIEAASYAQKLNDGFTSTSGLTYNDIALWIYQKARRNPASEWYAAYKRKDGIKTYYYSGNEVTLSIADYIAKPITKKLQTQGYKGSRWMEFLQGPAGLKGALTRAYRRYLDDYPAYTWATMTYKLNKMLEKLEK